jgi:hypothetical protein
MTTDLNADIDLGNGLVLELKPGGVKLGSSYVASEVEVKGGEVLVGGRPLEFREAVKCPAKVGSQPLCGEGRGRPRVIYKAVALRGFEDLARVAELYATDAFNKGDCLAYYLASLIRGNGLLWDIYYRRVPRGGSRCGYIDAYFISRGLRELAPHDPEKLGGLGQRVKAALGLLRFSEALGLVERSWDGFVVAMRYGIYSALRWRLEPGPDSWKFLLGLYSALDPVVVPGGVAVDNGVVRAVPYLVAKIMGGWAVFFSTAGHPYTASNLNIMAAGGRIRGSYASCDGDRCVVGDLYFNVCVESECAVVRTWDFEYKGRPICGDAYGFIALRPCR